MNNKFLELVEKASLKAEPPKFEVGDTVDVHTRIIEGEKERILAERRDGCTHAAD